MPELKVLCVNSYAGSLLLAAKASGATIVGSYENDGFGMKIQKENFKELSQSVFVPKTEQWPKQKDLSDVVVLAHPSCSAFSAQNADKDQSSRGLEAKAFQPTKLVLSYSFSNKALAVLVESVPGALTGAASVHEMLAEQYGYRLFRVLQNACSFGTAQWRPRFWAIFIRDDVAPEKLALGLSPMYRTVGQIMEEIEPGEIDLGVQKNFQKQVARAKSKGLSSSQLAEMLDGEDTGTLSNLIRKKLGLTDHEVQVRKNYLGVTFTASTIRVLSPAGFASTLMFDSVWYCAGRLLSATEYKAVMGFPRSYVFPPKSEFRKYLSKGVCPPVAQWLLKEVQRNLNDERLEVQPGMFIREGRQGEVLDFSVKRSEVEGNDLLQQRGRGDVAQAT